MPDAVADYFRSKGRTVAMLNKTIIGLDRRARSYRANILLYAHKNGFHYIAFRWNGQKFQMYNVWSDDRSSKSFPSLEEFLTKYNYVPISLISIS